MDIPMKVAERAATSYNVAAAGGCWLSIYSVASHGYAQIGWREGGRTVMTTAHRAAWVHHHGQILDGITVDHLCHVRRCVRPDHLRLLDNVANARDNGQDRRTQPLVLIGKTCRAGHDRLLYATGSIRCRECPQESDRKKYAERNRRRYPQRS